MEGMTYDAQTERRLKLAGKRAGSVILTGNRGSGMHHAALGLAKHFLGTDVLTGHPDYFEIDDREKTVTKEEVLRIVDLSEVQPVCGGKRVFLIDDAERLSAETQNVLLKTLEERTEKNAFLFVTHAPLIDTVRSRSMTVEFMPLPETYFDPCCEPAFLASRGTPGAYREIEADEAFLSFLNAVPAALADRKKLYELMGVMSEKDYKDRQFYATASGRQVEYLFNFITGALSRAYRESVSRGGILPENPEPLSEIRPERILRMLSVAQEYRNRLGFPGFSKTDFFSFLHRITEEV